MFLLLLYPKHVIKLSGYNLGCYSLPFASVADEIIDFWIDVPRFQQPRINATRNWILSRIILRSGLKGKSENATMNCGIID